MQSPVVRQGVDRANPHMLGRRFLVRRVETGLHDRSKLERSLVRHEAAQFDRDPVEHIGREERKVLQPVRGRHVRHAVMMVEAVFRLLERRRQVENRAAVLDRYNTPVGEAAAVACPVDLVHDRRINVSATEEIGMQ